MMVILKHCLMQSVKGMGIKKKKEVAEMWEIAPKCDPKGLRNQYVNGLIYRIGDIVESLHTGLIGKIIRRGTNHLICVTKEELYVQVLDS